MAAKKKKKKLGRPSTKRQKHINKIMNRLIDVINKTPNDECFLDNPKYKKLTAEYNNEIGYDPAKPYGERW